MREGGLGGVGWGGGCAYLPAILLTKATKFCIGELEGLQQTAACNGWAEGEV